MANSSVRKKYSYHDIHKANLRGARELADFHQDMTVAHALVTVAAAILMAGLFICEAIETKGTH